jgi:hypothetical protein
LSAKRGNLRSSPKLPPLNASSTRKKRKVSDLTVDDANALLRTLAEFQEQLDEEDKDLPTGLISGLEQLRKKLEVIPVRCSCCMRLNLLPDISPLSTLHFLKLMLDSPPGQNQDRTPSLVGRDVGHQKLGSHHKSPWPRAFYGFPPRADRIG